MAGADISGEKPVLIINACTEESLERLVGSFVDVYKKSGWEVIVLNARGGNPTPRKKNIEEVIATGRLRLVINIPHPDCKWVNDAADALYFGSETSIAHITEYTEVFRRFYSRARPSDRNNAGKRDVLHTRMALYAAKHFEEVWRGLLSGVPNFNFNRDFIQGKNVDARLYDRSTVGRASEQRQMMAGSGDQILAFPEPIGGVGESHTRHASTAGVSTSGEYTACIRSLHRGESAKTYEAGTRPARLKSVR